MVELLSLKKGIFIHLFPLKRYKNGTIEILLITKHCKKHFELLFSVTNTLVLGPQSKHLYKTL